MLKTSLRLQRTTFDCNYCKLLQFQSYIPTSFWIIYVPHMFSSWQRVCTWNLFACCIMALHFKWHPIRRINIQHTKLGNTWWLAQWSPKWILHRCLKRFYCGWCMDCTWPLNVGIPNFWPASGCITMCLPWKARANKTWLNFMYTGLGGITNPEGSANRSSLLRHHNNGIAKGQRCNDRDNEEGQANG